MKIKKYWYKTDIYYCVLCGKEDRVKERIYSNKPKDAHDRIVWHETACSEHF